MLEMKAHVPNVRDESMCSKDKSISPDIPYIIICSLLFVLFLYISAHMSYWTYFNFRLDNIKCHKKILIQLCSCYSQFLCSYFYFDSLYRSAVFDGRHFKIFWTFLCGNIGRVQRNCYIYNDDNRNNEWSILFNM